MPPSTRPNLVECENRLCKKIYKRSMSSKYCTAECRNVEWMLKKRTAESLKICKNHLCNANFYGGKNRKFCSNECQKSYKYHVARADPDAYRNCSFCWDWYAIWVYKDGRSVGTARKYCSARCRTVAVSLKRYGISPKEYWEMWRSQGGLCQICFTELGDPLVNQRDPGVWHKSPCIDHDHSPGAVRAILHQVCNINLAIIEKSSQATKNCLIYLEKHSEAK